MEDWQATVEAARASGIAAYGTRILDLPRRKLVALDVVDRGSSRPQAWEAVAVGDGFIAVTRRSDWTLAASNVLVRYRRDGTVAWSVRVATPSSGRRCTKFWPQAVYTTKTHLVVADRCIGKLSYDEQRATGKAEAGEIWRIPLASLPAID